jgi:hypothetical protein
MANFFDERELMLNCPRVPGFIPLDAITPRIRKITVNVW